MSGQSVKQPYVGDWRAEGFNHPPGTIKEHGQALTAKTFVEGIDPEGTLRSMLFRGGRGKHVHAEIDERLGLIRGKRPSKQTVMQYLTVYRRWFVKEGGTPDVDPQPRRQLDPEIIPATRIPRHDQPAEEANAILSELARSAHPGSQLVELLKATEVDDDIHELRKMDALIVIQEQRIVDMVALENDLRESYQGARYEAVSEEIDRLFRMNQTVCNLRADFGRYRRAKIGVNVQVNTAPPVIPSRDQPKMVELVGKLLSVIIPPDKNNSRPAAPSEHGT